MQDLLIIIPAYNEAENIVRTVEELKTVVPQAQYLVINDGSADETAAICRQHGYHLLDMPVNSGLSGAFQAGARYAYEHGCRALLQFDADGQHDPQFIPAMWAKMQETDCDIVIGSRFNDKAQFSGLRLMGNRLICSAIRLMTSTKIHDSTSGMRLYGERMLKSLAYGTNFGPEPDTISYLISCGAKVEEVRVTMRERQAGTSYLTVTRSIRYMVQMCTSILLLQLFRKGKEKKA